MPFLTNFLTCWGPRGALLSQTDWVSLEILHIKYKFGFYYHLPSNSHDFLTPWWAKSNIWILLFFYQFKLGQWPQRLQAPWAYFHHFKAPIYLAFKNLSTFANTVLGQCLCLKMWRRIHLSTFGVNFLLKLPCNRQYSTKNMQFTCVAFIITYFFLQRFCELDYTFHEEKAIIYKNHWSFFQILRLFLTSIWGCFVCQAPSYPCLCSPFSILTPVQTLWRS